MNRIDQAGKYILGRMHDELNGSLHYHNVAHVLDVMSAAEMIGQSEGINDIEMELLKVAALFHDAGFIISPENHEKLSCDIAGEFLPSIGFDSNEVESICNLIMATRVPQSPRNHLEKIMCDADLDYLGRDDFYTIANKIFQEFKTRKLVKDEKEWNEMQVKFLAAHNYFTPTSIRLRSAKKADHLIQIKQMLQESI